MKKALFILSAAILMLSVFSACGKNKTIEMEKPVGYEFDETHTTTQAQYTVGKEAKSVKNEVGKNEYDIDYMDEDGDAVKREHYKDKVLKYYIEISAADKDGNSVQQKYYDPKGKLVLTEDNGNYFDENGNEVTEEMLDYLLRELNK